MAKARSKEKVTQERSAGIILFREDRAKKLFLLLDYGRHWDYPKGHVEPGEDDITAALRELKEETGIDDTTLIDGFQEITYFFRHVKRGMVRKTVVFFLARTDREKIKLSHEHSGCEWLPVSDALKRLTNPTAKQVFTAATNFLQRQ